MQRVFRLVDTDDLTPMNLKPTDRMVQSVRRHGILTPVLLQERVDDDGVISLGIVDGNRRVSAAKQAGVEKIPAVVFQNADPEAMSAATVVTNTLRSRNAVSEWQAVEALGDVGHDAEQIMRLTGLTKASLETRLRPSTTHPDLRRAMLEGRLNVTVWERAGRLPPESQQRLADLMEHKGGLRLADVEQERARLEPNQDPGLVPEVSGKPASEQQLIEQLAVLARYVRSQGKGEYEWSKLTGDAWRRSSEIEADDRVIRETDADHDLDDASDHE